MDCAVKHTAAFNTDVDGESTEYRLRQRVVGYGVRLIPPQLIYRMK